MEDSKKPSLEKVIKKLEGLDIREWKREDYRLGPRFMVRIGGLIVYVFKNDGRGLREYHQITIVNQTEGLDVAYLNPKRKSFEEKCISKLYDKLNEEYEKYYKKEFEDALEQVFSD